MTSNGKKKPPPAPPPIILILTLQSDGKGTLLTKRGDLASLSSFIYRDTKEIVAAMEHGAAHLIEVEQTPPPRDLPAAAVPGAQPSSASVSEAATANDNPPEADSESSDVVHQAESAPIEPLSTAPDTETAQLSLF